MAFERRSHLSHGAQHRVSNNGSVEQRAWRVGDARVSEAELASWQLGPDLTQPLTAAVILGRRASDRH